MYNCPSLTFVARPLATCFYISTGFYHRLTGFIYSFSFPFQEQKNGASSSQCDNDLWLCVTMIVLSVGERSPDTLAAKCETETLGLPATQQLVSVYSRCPSSAAHESWSTSTRSRSIRTFSDITFRYTATLSFLGSSGTKLYVYFIIFTFLSRFTPVKYFRYFCIRCSPTVWYNLISVNCHCPEIRSTP